MRRIIAPITALVAFMLVLLVYLFKIGGESYVYLTDFMVFAYSLLAVLVSFFSWKKLSKSQHGKSLLLILIGISFWSLAELFWFIFSEKVYWAVESLRFLGYVPLTAGFFFLLRESNPQYAEHKKYIIASLAYFINFAILYLIIIPAVFKQESVWDSITVYGYIFADFTLLFGIAALLMISYRYRGHDLSFVWFIFALAFMSVFSFDLYFAFNWKNYYFGHISEILVILNYILIALGFHLGSSIIGDEEKFKIRLLPLYSIMSTTLVVLLFFLLMIKQNDPIYYGQINFDEARKDFKVVFKKDVLQRLNENYRAEGPEYLYCLIGKQEGNQIMVDSLVNEKLIYQSAEYIIYETDPPCQINGSVGSLHTHPKNIGCNPSSDDFFTFGEMKNPEPIVNAVQCDVNKFYIFKMPGKQESFDFRLLDWEAID